jgi:hypothetical protein
MLARNKEKLGWRMEKKVSAKVSSVFILTLLKKLTTSVLYAYMYATFGLASIQSLYNWLKIKVHLSLNGA